MSSCVISRQSLGPTGFPRRPRSPSTPLAVAWAIGQKVTPRGSPASTGTTRGGPEGPPLATAEWLSTYHLPVVGQPPLPVGVQSREVPVGSLAMLNLWTLGEVAFETPSTVYELAVAPVSTETVPPVVPQVRPVVPSSADESHL